MSTSVHRFAGGCGVLLEWAGGAGCCTPTRGPADAVGLVLAVGNLSVPAALELGLCTDNQMTGAQPASKRAGRAERQP